ncbi:MAG: gliding motility lipoprotein GldH [Saprospiraceae bacterium]|nr:gliding motility lipoprotein GldH [Saprospiraceae bacterium]
MGKFKYQLLSIGLISILILLLVSCSSDTIFEENKQVNENWNKNDTLCFKVEISDLTLHYNFYINIRNSTDYGFSNFYFFMNSVFPDRNIQRDTIECILANLEGKWLGKGFGGIKENNMLLQKGIIFPQEGIYEFIIEHAMRVDKNEGLHGIKNIGIRIESDN